MRSMKLIIGLMTSISTIASSAQAAGGCGPGYHRGPYDYCRPNFGPGPVIVAPYGPRVGYYYPRRGWWYGGHYWGNRYRWHGYWRYR